MVPVKPLLAALSVTALLAGCGGESTRTEQETTAASATPAAPQEQGSRTPRLALSYDGGVLVLDAKKLEQVADIPVDGYLRLNSAQDGRHVLVSQSDGFTVLDMGTWAEAHGDHRHYYTAEPQLTDIRFGGEKPGHVVAHDGLLTFFSDGTGQVDVVDPRDLSTGAVQRRVNTTAHHGVAVARADGTVVVSVGDDESRSGVEILDNAGNAVASNDQCPGLHGEAAAADGVLTFGCENGILIVRGNNIEKVASPDPYGRIGNQAGSDESPVVLGDYKVDPDAELERPERFTLTDTATGEISIVPIHSTYSFRSLGRGPAGEAVLLGADGALHVFDPATGAETAHYPVIEAWTEPEDWQDPMPTLHILGSTAYISSPAERRLLAVDLANGAVTAETTLDKETSELTGVTG
ncbi:zinc metallochaperone AztD [Mycolicibacterium brumae]|uniref:Secreted protein n=1 Tax=Mycolicibacterium brumae TaxID=85968 RepID=A0A2G5P811_9MYCO|nr:zinc metallochaperone AztD [Mycolicibacterium brumae]MCV7194586.1 hypothetical protein [Mycolicibacterium brumae]PIB74230.1 hypothetical protein CQY22_013885 [Mycolicibacterium brumae]UWW08925.1 hypothetical protein L2Z93_002003 [Mycolicibacterium brumae]